MEREPREAGLVALETGAFDIVGADWHKRLDKVFIENLGKYRKYQGASVQDLLRALRNKVCCALKPSNNGIIKLDCRNIITRIFLRM
jgi:Ribonuclease 2-5A